MTLGLIVWDGCQSGAEHRVRRFHLRKLYLILDATKCHPQIVVLLQEWHEGS